MADYDLHDIQLALIKIGENDTGSGGLVELTGKSQPMITWNSVADASLPVVAINVIDADYPDGSDSENPDAEVDFDVFCGPGETALASDIVARILERVTATRLNSHGVDAALHRQTVTPNRAGDGEGYRLTLNATID